MQHKKDYHSITLETPNGVLVIEGPVAAERLIEMDFDPGLVAFRQPEAQKKAIVEIAKLPEGRIIIARKDNTVVGYVTFLYPDPLERWSQGNMDDLLELGAIEVSHKYRAGQVGKKMLQVAFMDDAMEDFIVITTEYYWHWDLKNTGLSVWDYRKIMEKLMGSVGMEWYATDDPEICSHPANCLMARIGKRVPLESIQQFDRLRFQNRFMY
ncbi:N-acetyltransferase [Microaerobacter geothermalis]|uniref:GNAT family N-acetyltransferase n=1 Tax=Microaerobacter geothermalis TaxID=674972 RepID=UPI001F38914E|nr:GNAT family N-acetyltransferase [Microaerobacter geothermalis]MCF6094909.1 N-acetyltransferase [Microaerobacter geothermalis]